MAKHKFMVKGVSTGKKKGKKGKGKKGKGKKAKKAASKHHRRRR